MGATVIALLVSEGNGKAAWMRYKAEGEAKGEVFDWRASIPPEIPEHLNFIKHPVFDIVEELRRALDLSELIHESEGPPQPDWTRGQLVDFSNLLAREQPMPDAEP